MVFVAFQLTFAIITPALITGSTADRWKFGAFVAFVSAWSILIYAPVAHWVFDGYGFLNQSLRPAGKFFAEDFAGGTVVHINAGAAGLAMAFVLGRRRGWPRENMRGHNIPFVMLGAGLLWFGWFGFNAGSALSASNLAGYAWMNTNTATATALIGWVIVEKLRYGKSTALGAASGAVAGLVAITPCAGFVSVERRAGHRPAGRGGLRVRDRAEEQARFRRLAGRGRRALRRWLDRHPDRSGSSPPT